MKYVLIILLIFSSVPVLAQSEKTVDSKIKRVTVFLNRAQVTREVKTRLEGGKTNLVISGLTSQLDQQSVQVRGRGNFIILGINHNQNFLNEFNRPKKLQVLHDSLDISRRLLAQEQNQKEALTKEEQLLVSNQKIGGNNQNLSVNELKAMADFYRTRLVEIGSQKIKTDEKIKSLSERIQSLSRQIREMTELYSRNTSELVVSVSSDGSTAAELEISYIVANAGWHPVYDLRAINTKSPVQLQYKANVYQSTGEDWNNVKLVLSTANPSLSGVKPELLAWYLDFYEPAYKALQGRVLGAAQRSAAMKAEEAAVYDKETLPMAQSLNEFTSVVQTSLNTEFDISLPYTVASASKPTLVDIRSHEMKADYVYAAAPKLDSDAFLMAKATGWEEFNLLPGEANVFFEGTFVGKTFIDPNSILDTLSVSLGRDQRVVVKREKVKDFTTKKAIASNMREAFAWELSVRNTKNEPVRITLEDQVPVTKNNQIEVSVLDVGGAIHNKETGKLTWNLVVQPNETKKVVFKYEVKYPKDKKVSGL